MGIIPTSLIIRLDYPKLCIHPALSSLCVCVLVARSLLSDSLQPHGLWPTRPLCSWNLPGKNNGVGCHSLLHRMFPIQGSNPSLLHCRQILYHLSHQGSLAFPGETSVKTKASGLPLHSQLLPPLWGGVAYEVPL